MGADRKQDAGWLFPQEKSTLLSLGLFIRILL
jgi:hypothetical protein